MIETTIGPYQIVAKLGEGGMGEVYRARDARLGRDVAVKVLPRAFADDPDRRARFEREAQAVAALSHPNVVAIFDTGVHDGELYVVMELLAGETLRERLGRGALTTRKAIEVAVQIARGLGAAHGKGLVHRDLKPENVFVQDDGLVKILDFGLARQTAEPAGSGATATVAVTDPGTVMGTIGYMAPEQVRGQVVDARADIFAFGAVLYEMVTGQRAFQRATAADTMTAILTQEPQDLAALRPDLAPALDRIVRHCLEKNANERFQSARDVAFALDALSGTGSSTSGTGDAAVAPPTKRRWLMPLGAIVALAIAGAGGFTIGRAGRVESTEVRFESKTWDQEWVTNARFAPDGQAIVFSAARTGNTPSLYAIRAGSLVSQPIGKPGAHLLSVSSKGELAVLTNPVYQGHRMFRGTLARMTLDGASRDWMDDVSEADWSPDGSTLAITRVAGGKFQLEYPMGKVLYTATSGYLSDPRVSRDGTSVAFFEHQFDGDDRGSVKIAGPGGVKSLGGEYWALEGMAWSVDGASVIFAGSTLGQEALQPLIVNVTGDTPARRALTGSTAMFVFDITKDGRMLISSDDFRLSVRGLVPGAPAEQEFPWLDFAEAGYFTPDFKRLVFTDESQSAGADYQVALRDVTTGQVVRLGPGSSQRLSPDGKLAPGLVSSTGRFVLYPTGTGDAVTLERGPLERYAGGLEWFADGRRVAVCGNEPGKASRCYEQEIPKGTLKPITPEGTTIALPAPDGRTLLVRSAGGFEIMTIGGGAGEPAKGVSPTDQVLTWTADGRGLIVTKKLGAPMPVERVDLATGKRTLLRELAPPDRGGFIGASASQWIENGPGYVYTYVRELSRLLVVTGVR